MYITMKNVGSRCQEFRKSLGLNQHDVASDTGYSLETVASFEQGRNNNACLLVWYLSKGLHFPLGVTIERNRKNGK